MQLFVFFKQKTAYEMRISDWSSDVCSSDLRAEGDAERRALGPDPRQLGRRRLRTLPMRADRLLVTAQLGRNRTRAVKQAGDARHLSLQRGGGLRDKAAEPPVIARRVQVLQRRPLPRDPGRQERQGGV